MVNCSVSIREEQKKFIDDNYINLSAFVRNAIDVRMNKDGTANN